MAADDDARRPTRRRWAFVIAAGATYVGAGQGAARALLRSEAWDWAGMFLYGGIWAITMVAVAGALQAGWFPAPREAAGRDLVCSAIDTGALPDDARPEAWRRALAEELRQLRQSRWVAGALMLLVAACVAAAAVGTGDPLVGVLAAGLAGFTALPDRWLSRRAGRAEALLARVDAG